MTNQLTPTRLNFVKIATQEFGNGAVLSMKDIANVCKKHNTPIAQWFYTSDKYKVGRSQYKLPELGEIMPVVGHQLNLATTVAGAAQMSQEVAKIAEKSDDELLEEINNSFVTLDIMAKFVKSGESCSFIVGGDAGVGKSHNIEKVLGAENPNVFYVHGKIKATNLYKKLYEYRHKGQILVIDDSDELFFDETSLNLLKNALDTKGNRHLSWLSEYILTNEEGDVPNSFNYRGSVIFISNIDFYGEIAKGTKLSKHLNALLSRSFYLDIKFESKRKSFLHTTNVLYNGMIHQLGLHQHEQDELIDYIEQNLNQLREITPRMAKKIAILIKNGGQWKMLANRMCLKA